MFPHTFLCKCACCYFLYDVLWCKNRNLLKATIEANPSWISPNHTWHCWLITLSYNISTSHFSSHTTFITNVNKHIENLGNLMLTSLVGTYKSKSHIFSSMLLIFHKYVHMYIGTNNVTLVVTEVCSWYK